MDLTELWGKFAEALAQILPLSPFRPFLESFQDIPYLGYLNWFVPVGEILTVLSAWCTTIGIFYLYSVVLRWIKVVGD